MKKLILLFALFIGLIANAQDLQYLETLKSIPSHDQVIQITNQIVNQGIDKLRLYKSKEVTEYSTFVVQYVPANLTDEEVEKNKDLIKDDFVIFQFKYWNKDENKALKQEGTKHYVFSEVKGHYLNLFPFWSKNIDPTADKEQLAKKGNIYKIGYSFSGSNGNWKIKA